MPHKMDLHFLLHIFANRRRDGEITDVEDIVVVAFTTLHSYLGCLPLNLHEVVEDTRAYTLYMALSAVLGENEVIEVPPYQD